jgi:N-acetylglucosaminyl-diphospho-decaprenol L-rhamnosyltransferase
MSEAGSDKNPTTHVSIAIVAADEQKNIVGCLKSLDKLTYRNFSVVICENMGHQAFNRDLQEVSKIDSVVDAATDEACYSGQPAERRFWLGADKRLVRIIRSRVNGGYAGGVNVCIAGAGQGWDFIWVLNADTFPEKDALGALVRRQAEGGYGIIGSRIVFVATGRVQRMGGMKFFPLLGRCRSPGCNASIDVKPDIEKLESKLDIIVGTAMFVSNDYIKTVGVMDEDFFVYCEDTEWSLRRGKFRLGYAHDSVVHHVAGATSGSGGPTPKRSRFCLYLSERNRILVAKKRSPATWRLNAFLMLLQTSEYLIRFHSYRAFKIGLSGWWAGVKGETGMPGFMRQSQGASAKVFLKNAK